MACSSGIVAAARCAVFNSDSNFSTVMTPIRDLRLEQSLVLTRRGLLLLAEPDAFTAETAGDSCN